MRTLPLCGAIQKICALNEKEYSDMCTKALDKAQKEFCPEQYIDRLLLEYDRCKLRRGGSHE
jgi:hypothetical protein